MPSKNIVAAGDINTALAVKEVLEKGGNAFDGAVAGVFAAYMAEPALTSPAGGGYLMAYDGRGEPILYDFFVESVPKREKKPDFFPIEVDFGDETQIFHIGMGSVAVPGTVKGLLKVHSERGNLPLEEVLKPAIRYSSEGIYLSPVQAKFVKLLEKIFTATEEAKKIFAPDGELINERKLYRNRDYTEFLKLLSEEGERAFYHGEVADRIDNLSRERKGLIRKEDLERYEVLKREPLKISYKGYEVYLNPPPSAGGILVAFALLLLNGENLTDFGSLKHISTLAEVLYTVKLFRERFADRLLREGNITEYLNREDFVTTFKRIAKELLNLWGNTTHLAVSDKEGNVVSITTTNGEGSGYVIPGFGVMLNNMLGEEDLNPEGFFKWKPYTRLPSMMCPTMVFKDGELLYAFGSAGSNRIRSVITQMVLNLVDFKMGPKNAVEVPRLHVENGTLYLEPPLGESFLNELEKMFKVVRFREKNVFFGGVQMVAPPLGTGAGDPRRGGVVLVF